MRKLSHSFNLTEAKIQAQILLKNLSDTEKSAMAIQRLVDVGCFSKKDPIAENAQLKHALLVIAIERGFSSWVSLKNYFTTTGQTKFIPRGGFFNQWFVSYKEAKKILLESPDKFLLPYQEQFFLCESGYIDFLGLDSHAKDWQLIGNNWLEPTDLQAWERLNSKYLVLTSTN